MDVPRQSEFSIWCDRVFESETMRFAPKSIRVAKGRFQSVEPLENFDAPEGETILDLRGSAMAPPLVDPHIHVYMNPWPLDPSARAIPGSRERTEEIQLARRRMEDAHLAGLGWGRDLGDPLGVNLAVAEDAKSNPALPRILASGCAVYLEGRYGRFIGKPVADREGLCQAVMALINDPRVDLVKLIPTGIVNFKKGLVTAPPQFSTADLRAAVTIAHDHGKKVAAHCSGEPGIRHAVEAGVDFIEHGYFIERETMELLAEKQLVWTPTLAPVHAQWNHAKTCGWDDVVKANIRSILDNHLETLSQARQTGVKIMAGSDAGSPGVPHGGGLIRELELMETAGFSPLELLAMATTRAVCWIHGETETDRIAPGAPADFIVFRGNLQVQGISVLRHLEWVARDGIVRPGSPPAMESDDGAENYGLVTNGGEACGR